MKRYHLKSLLAITLLAFQPLTFAATTTIYGLKNAEHFQSKAKGHFYIVAGNFKVKSNAKLLAKSVQAKTQYPVSIKQTKNWNTVIIGPMKTASKVRAVSLALNTSSVSTPHARHIIAKDPAPVMKPQHHKAVIAQHEVIDPPAFTARTKGNWFITGTVGSTRPSVDRTMTVNNGTGFPAPYDNDIYTTSSSNAVIFAVEGGYRWKRDQSWLPSYALSARYEHLFPSNIGSQVEQYSLSAFTNYNYQLNTTSDVFLAIAKLNLVQIHQLSPYINGGAGFAFNRAFNYTETAMPDVTPRTSPSFASNTSTSFVYSLGAGVDWQFQPQFIMSVGYEYQDLGKINTGHGTAAWSNAALNSGTYRTSNVLLSLNYLFDKP